MSDFKLYSRLVAGFPFAEPSLLCLFCRGGILITTIDSVDVIVLYPLV